MIGRAAALAVATVVLAAAPASGSVWRLQQPPPPPPPPGQDPAPFAVPLGAPGDMEFYARNRGLLAVEGNATVPRGLYVYNGSGWREMATVCGGSADTTRIAWAGPDEFWTIADVRAEQANSGAAAGTTLCHFADGQIVASYATAPRTADEYLPMNAAACRAPDDCWFGGFTFGAPNAGVFNLHWDGSALTRIDGPQGRPVTDMVAHRGRLFETVNVSSDNEAARLTTPESAPALLHRIDANAKSSVAFHDDPFLPAPVPGEPNDVTGLLGLDSDGTQLWAVGGAAFSGPHGDESANRGPIAVVFDEPSNAFRELTLVPLDADHPFDPGEQFVDVGAVPGTSRAWVATNQNAGATARVVLLERQGANAKVLDDQVLPAADDPDPNARSNKGSSQRIACPAANDCWMVTNKGWVFHYTDGTRPPLDDDPAFSAFITTRPADGSSPQFVPDTLPLDDSGADLPPIDFNARLDVPQTRVAPISAQSRTLKPLLEKIRSKLRRRLQLSITFTLNARARIAVVARRAEKIVARTKPKVLKSGRHTLVLRLSRRRWPTRISFDARALAPLPEATTGSDDSSGDATLDPNLTVTTGGG